MAGNLWTKLWKQLFGWRSDSSKPTQGEVAPSEELSTWVKRMDEVAISAGVIKHARLMPRLSEDGRPETSVCRSSGLNDARVWQICTVFFDPSNAPKTAIGRGRAPASTVYDESLSLDPNGDPYPEHADIIGWPYDPARPYEDNKHVWKMKAQKMAEHFRYEARPAGM